MIFIRLLFSSPRRPSRYAELILILEQPRIPHATLMSSDAPESSASSERGKRQGRVLGNAGRAGMLPHC